MYRLFVAAIAMMFSVGCHAVCKIFLVKSKLSTLMSSFLRLPPTQTLRGLRIARGLLLSRDASRVTSRLVFRSNIRKKLLYAPVIITLRRERERRENKDNWTAACGKSTDTTGSGQLSFHLRIRCLLVSECKTGFFPVLPRVNGFPLPMSAPSLLAYSVTQLPQNSHAEACTNVRALTSWDWLHKTIKVICLISYF